MQARNSSILEVREYNGRTILCQLRVMPRPVAATEKQSLSYRWLQNKHWARLDDELERILDSVFDQRRKLESEQAFSIDPQIRVRLRRSCIPVEMLLRCVNDEQLDRTNIALALECFIEHDESKKLGGVYTNESVEAVLGCNETDSEYNPQQVCSQTDSDISFYVPYTPAKKNGSSSTSGELMNTLECATEQEDRYSPLPVLELSPVMTPRPTYTPSPINRKLRSASKLENICNTSSETEIDVKSEEKYLPDKAEALLEWPERSSRREADTKIESITTHKSENSKVELNILHNEVSQSFSPLSEHDKEGGSDGSQETKTNFTTQKQKKSPKNAAIPSAAVAKASKKLKYKRDITSHAGKSKEHILTPQQDEVVAGILFRGEKYLEKKQHGSRSKKTSDQRYKPIAERTELKLNKKLIDIPKALDAKQSSGNDCLTKQRHAQSSRSKSSPVDDGTAKEPRSLMSVDNLRRTVRSPKRLIDEVLSASKRPHKKVQSPSKLGKFDHKPRGMKDMFGSDTDGDDFAAQTPAPKTVYSKLSSTKKRKRKHTSNCVQEKQSIGQWLNKKLESDTFKAKKPKSPIKATDSKPAPAATSSPEVDLALELPTKEEMAERMSREKLQMEKNKKIQEMLKDLMESTKPKEVDILSLDDMSSKDILATFNQYKSTLDDTFQKLRKKPNVAGYNGVNHYAVMDLINTNKQLEMMHKLGEVYERDHEGTSLYTKLFANVLMPEWVLGIFKEKFQLTHTQAIKQLKAQRDYKFYLEYQDK